MQKVRSPAHATSSENGPPSGQAKARESGSIGSVVSEHAFEIFDRGRLHEMMREARF
jgi:hypothetical protein